MSVTGAFTKAEAVTALPTTGEFREDPTDGSLVPVLDVNRISFENAVWGRKKAATPVVRAQGGELVRQEFGGKEETEDYIAEKDDAIFVNGPNDSYVPSDGGSGRMKFDQMELLGYKIVSSNAGYAMVLSPPAKLLVGIIDARVCIKTSRVQKDGDPDYQFFSPGSTLKQAIGGKVGGMAATGFEKWETGAQYAPALALT